MFSFLSFPKTSYFITLANGSKVVSLGIGQVSFSPSLNLISFLFIHECPFSLVSLCQVTKSLNCSKTFDGNSFVIHECGTGQMIGKGHEVEAFTTLALAHLFLVLLHYSKVKKIVHEVNSLQTLECQLYQLGKHVSEVLFS